MPSTLNVSDKSRHVNLSVYGAGTNQLDDVEALDGMPISLQLVGRRFEEEKVLAMTEQVRSALA